MYEITYVLYCVNFYVTLQSINFRYIKKSGKHMTYEVLQEYPICKITVLMKVKVDMAIRKKVPQTLLEEIRGKPFWRALMTIGQWNQGCW